MKTTIIGQDWLGRNLTKIERRLFPVRAAWQPEPAAAAATVVLTEG